MKFTIDRKIWARGGRSLLYSGYSRKMCCVGIYCHALGIEKQAMEGVGSADGDVLVHPFVQLLQTQTWMWAPDNDHAPGFPQYRSEDISELYHVNDDETLDESAREAKIKEIFARNGVEVEFVD